MANWNLSLLHNKYKSCDDVSAVWLFKGQLWEESRKCFLSFFGEGLKKA